MDWRFTDEPQREFTGKTLARLAAYVAERRALVRPFFKSIDPHNNGHLPRSRFRQGLTISELHCTDAEMQALEARFGNDVGVNYLAFLDIVEPKPPVEWKYIERIKDLRTTNSKPPLPELYPADSVEALLLKIKTKVLLQSCTMYTVYNSTLLRVDNLTPSTPVSSSKLLLFELQRHTV